MPRIRNSNYTWTEKQVGILVRVWPFLTASQIGDRIGKSRSAVLGKVRRLNLKK